MGKRISAVMAVYNGARYLEDQLLSIINQTKKIDELVIIDDCSTDESGSIINNCLADCECELKYIVHKKNRGYAQTFFEALSYTTGDFVFLSDQDDVWEPHKVQTCVQVLEGHLEISCLSSLNILVDSSGSEIRREQRRKEQLYKVPCEELIKQKALRPGMTLVIRRELVDQLTKMNTTQYEQHDRLIEYLSSINNGFYLLGEFLNRYRIHGNNTSGLNLSHHKLRSDRNGRIDQIDKEIRYLELIKFLDKNNTGLIERYIKHYLLRKRLLQGRKIVQYVFNLPQITRLASTPRIWLGDILSILKIDSDES